LAVPCLSQNDPDTVEKTTNPNILSSRIPPKRAAPRRRQHRHARAKLKQNEDKNTEGKSA
jgi:hypothetical protein